jgi:hypothetical protein
LFYHYVRVVLKLILDEPVKYIVPGTYEEKSRIDRNAEVQKLLNKTVSRYRIMIADHA